MLVKARRSDSLYITGIRRTCSEDDVRQHFSQLHPVLSVTMTDLGYAIVKYSSEEQAQDAVTRLNQSFLKGKALCVRFNFGVGVKSASTSSSSYIISRQQPLSSLPSSSSTAKSAMYTSNSLILPNGTEYPLSTGKYLFKLLHRRHMSRKDWEICLFNVLLERQSCKQCKELTECMAVMFG